ncbi:hypothetical protein CPC16_003561 [Podila verticillata]|nr:hypothetical protein CPC16_003561 [Podila verticillata]
MDEWMHVFSEDCISRVGLFGRQYHSSPNYQLNLDHQLKNSAQAGDGKITLLWKRRTSWYRRRACRVVGGTMDSEFYIKQTRDRYNMDAAQFVFMQDNVSVLVAQIVKQRVTDNNINVLWWPINSAILNPVEHG